MTSSRRALVAVAAAAALAACGEDPEDERAAGTSPAPAAAAPVDLLIVVNDGAGGTARASITCAGSSARGTGYARSPERAAALCRSARELGPALAAGPPADAICTEQYGGPQTATVTGRVGSRTIRRRFSRTDGCRIAGWDAAAALFAGSGVRIG